MDSSDRNPLWSCAVDVERARHVLGELQRSEAAAAFLRQARPASLRALIVVAGGSRHLAVLLTRHPDWVADCFRDESLTHGRRADGLRTEATALLDEAMGRADHAAALAALRHFHAREQLRIAARDLSGAASVEEVVRELSDLADVCLQGVYRVVRGQLAARLGEPWHCGEDGRWQRTPFCVLALGKLGGRELNYSSDVDLMFLYGDEGQVFRDPPGERAGGRGAAMASHAFFRRLAEAFSAEVGRMAPEGLLYRVDLRLRPDGDAGPLARSLESLETYYAESGQTWERLMLLKARPVAGNRELGDEFLESIQPFRHPRAVSERLLDEIAGLKARLENEVAEGGAARDVKRGRGGIREVEFTVQSLQLLHAGRQPFLQQASTLPALAQLAQYALLKPKECDELADAYRFWRQVEHRLQMNDNRQTHALPTDTAGLMRLARLTGFNNVEDFERRRGLHAEQVRAVYERVLGTRRPVDPAPGLPDLAPRDEAGWAPILARHGFRDPAAALRRLREMIQGPGWSHVSARTGNLGRALLPHLLSLCPGAPGPRPAESRVEGTLSDPDRVVARLERFVQVYRSRSVLFESWSSNPRFFELLLWLFDRSEALGEIALRTPDLVDELVMSGQLRRSKSVSETVSDLRHGLSEADQSRWLRKYRQAEILRVGLRSLLGMIGTDETLAELSVVAEACLRHAMEILQTRHRLRRAPFAVIALGKLGGAELNFGSDLDVLFVAPDSCRDLGKAIRLATEFIALMSAPSDLGPGYEIDCRLRPDGEKGLLVNTVGAHLEYWRQRARLWEIQSVVRARPVAGHGSAGQRFLEAAARVTDFSRGNPGIACWSPGWAAECDRMLERIRNERTRPADRDLALKTGEGGLMTAEFLAQKWCLANGWSEPNTRAALGRGVRAGLAGRDAGKALLQAFDDLRRIKLVLRRWSCVDESCLPSDPVAQGRVAARCGFADATELRETVHRARTTIRDAAGNVSLTAPRDAGGAGADQPPTSARASAARAVER